jgi:hypothetical protein
MGSSSGWLRNKQTSKGAPAWCRASLNYLIDINNAIIVDVEATPVRTNDEVTANKTTLDRTDIRCGLKPKATGPRRGLRDGQVPAVAKRRQPRSFARPGLLARHPSPAV